MNLLYAIIIFFIVNGFSDAFTINTQHTTISSRVYTDEQDFEGYQELKGNESFELFGRQFNVPEWMSGMVRNTRQFFESMLAALGFSSNSNVVASTDYWTLLKKDSTTRLWCAFYINCLVIVLIYIFIAIKLLLLSIKEDQQEAQKRKTYEKNMSFGSPDLNIPLASISKRHADEAAPLVMTVDNPDFMEMGREVLDEHDIEMQPAYCTAIEIKNGSNGSMEQKFESFEDDEDEGLEMHPTTSNANPQNIYDDIPSSSVAL